MGNNFYVGDIFHRRKFRSSSIEKNVLVTEDNYNYFALFGTSGWYTIDNSQKDYVIKDSLVLTSIEEHRDGLYLYDINKDRISRGNIRGIVRTRKRSTRNY